MPYVPFNLRVLAQISLLIQLVASAPSQTASCTPISSAPADGCAVQGRIKYDQQEDFPVGSPQIVSSLEECAFLCERRVYGEDYYGYFKYENPKYDYGGPPPPGTYYEPYCQSFQYRPDTGACQLGRLDVTSAVQLASKTGSFFYNSTCFTCGKVCTAEQPLGAQLIDNGDFQDKLFGPWQSYLGEFGTGHKSSKAWFCSDEHSGRCSLSQEINMCEGEMYLVQFDYLPLHTNQSRAPPTIHVVFGGYESVGIYGGIDGSGAYTYDFTSNNTDPKAWKTIRGYFEYFGKEHTGPFFTFDGAGSHSIDNVLVARVPSNPATVTRPKNLFRNGGFETGEISPWHTGDFRYDGYDLNPQPFKVVSPGINSKHALSFSTTKNFYTFASMYLSQTIATIANGTYLISFDMQITGRPFVINTYTSYKGFGRVQNVRRWHPGNYSISLPVVAENFATLVQFEVFDAAHFEVYHRLHPSKIVMDNFKMVQITKGSYFL